MEMTDEEFVREFIKGTPDWYETLLEPIKERDHCPICGTPPSYMKRLAEILSKDVNK